MTVLESIEERLLWRPLDYPHEFGNGRYYDIAWTSLLEQIHAEQLGFKNLLEIVVGKHR